MNMRSVRDIVVIILAGGQSKRFWPLNNKNLLVFSKYNLLEYHLRSLSNLGIRDFVVICNTEVAAFLRVNSKNFNGINISRVLQDGKNPGIGKAVLLAANIINKYYQGRPVYVLNADDIYDPLIHEQLFRYMLKKQPFMLLAAYEVSCYRPFGYFKANKDRIIGLIEKPLPDKLPSNLANMALHLYADFSKLEKSLRSEEKNSDRNDDLYERAIDKLCQAYTVEFIKYNGKWESLKYPWDVLAVSEYFLSDVKEKISAKAYIDRSVKIEGQVIIEEDVKLMEFVVIKGPAIIKKGTIIGTGSLIRGSIIGENCVVGYCSEITRSYIGNNCWFHTNYIGDSVLGNNVNMGAGAVIANLRFDQKNIFSYIDKVRINTGRTKLGAIVGNGVQIGVNTSIMPGIKVGKNTIIGPGIVLNEDLEDNVALFLKQQQVKKRDGVGLTLINRRVFRELLK